MASDFLAENNLCGKNLLELVAKGNAILTEMQRLSDFIPDVFKEGTSEAAHYKGLLCDFTYFSTSELFDNRINSSPEVQDLDDEFRENYITTLTRFFRVLESVHKYVVQLNGYLEDLNDGKYVQQTLESVFRLDDGKQLLCEALYLYGVMLLIVDSKLPGPIREQMIVSYHRYRAQDSTSDSNIEDVCTLWRSTGFLSTSAPAAGGYTPMIGTTPRPKDYPESLFARINIQRSYIEMVLERLKSDDIYHALNSYPRPEHRNTALATQASMLFVCLFFAPDLLKDQEAMMREIVDRHFSDNWVVSVYMGTPYHLLDSWSPYKAALMALNNTLSPNNIKQHAVKHGSAVPKLSAEVARFLKEGVLTETFLLDNIPKLLMTTTQANVTVRWLMLHTSRFERFSNIDLRDANNKKIVAVSDSVRESSRYNEVQTFRLLLLTSEFELTLREMFRELLEQKEARWSTLQKEVVSRLQELRDVFSGTIPLTRVQKNDKLQRWFDDLANKIQIFSFSESTKTGRLIDQMIQALREVLDYHQLDDNLQVRQFLKDICSDLQQMIRIVNLQEQVLINLQLVADLSYAWKIVDMYTPHMQDGIKRDPSLTIKLKATFLKLASAMEMPLLRVNQAGSADFSSVSQYYSTELVGYVRKVLQIIPRTMFEKLHSIIQLQTTSIKEIPTRLEKDKMKDFAQLDERYEVAKLTHDISIFTEGILMMKQTLIGIVKMDPKQLLEDGIRKELVLHVSNGLHRMLVFNPKAKQSELLPKLQQLGAAIDGYRRSFEYIQDYINVYGLKIWQEEVSRIINFNVERECNSFLRQKVDSWQSVYQSRSIPIPTPARLDPVSVSFMGRLGQELLRLSDPRTTVYVERLTTWYDARSKAELVTLRTFKELDAAVDSFGLAGLDRLYAFMLVRDLQRFAKLYAANLERDKGNAEAMNNFSKQLRALEETPPTPNQAVQALKLLTNMQTKCSRLLPQFLEVVMRVGQLQLLRKAICHQLNCSCKFDSKFLASALQNLNDALLKDVVDHYSSPEKPYPGEDNALLFELTAYLEAAGMDDPLAKIYMTAKRMPHGALLIFLITVNSLSRLQYHRSAENLLPKRPVDALDATPLALGVATLVRQYHVSMRDSFLQLMGLHVKLLIEALPSQKVQDYPQDALTALVFLDDLLFFAGLPRSTLELYIPAYIVSEYRSRAV